MTKKHESQKGKLLEPLCGPQMAFYTTWDYARPIEDCSCPWCGGKMVIACDPDGFVWAACKENREHRVKIINGAISRKGMVRSAQRRTRAIKKKLLMQAKENRRRLKRGH